MKNYLSNTTENNTVITSAVSDPFDKQQLDTHRLSMPKSFAKYYVKGTYEDRENKLQEWHGNINDKYKTSVGKNNNIFLEEQKVNFLYEIDLFDKAAYIQIKNTADEVGYKTLIQDFIQAYRECAKELKKGLKREIELYRKTTELYFGHIDFSKAEKDPKDNKRIFIDSKYISMREEEKDSFTSAFSQTSVYSFESDFHLAHRFLLEKGKMCYLFLGAYSQHLQELELQQKNDVLDNQLSLDIDIKDTITTERALLNNAYDELFNIMVDFMNAAFKPVDKYKEETVIHTDLELADTLRTMVDTGIKEVFTRQQKVKESIDEEGNKTYYADLTYPKNKGLSILYGSDRGLTLTSKKLAILVTKALNDKVGNFSKLTDTDLLDKNKMIISISLQDYMKATGTSDRKNAKKQLDTAYEQLLSLSLLRQDNSDETGKEVQTASIFSRTGIKLKNKSGVVFLFDPYFIKDFFIAKGQTLNLRTDTLRIKEEKAFTLSTALQDRAEVLINKGAMKRTDDVFTVSIESIIKNILVGSIPRYEDIKESGEIRRRIINPVIDTLNSLTKYIDDRDCPYRTKDNRGKGLTPIQEPVQDLIISYKLTPKPNGETPIEPLKQKDFDKLTYEQFIKLNVTLSIRLKDDFRPKDYMNQLN